MLTQEMLDKMVERIKVITKREGAYNFYVLPLMLAYENMRNLVSLVAFNLAETNNEKVMSAYKAVITNIERIEARHEELEALKKKYPDPFKNYQE